MRLALPGRVAGAVAADVGVGPVLTVGDALVGGDHLVALASEEGNLVGDDLGSNTVDGRVLEGEVGVGEAVGDVLHGVLLRRDRGTDRVVSERVPEPNLCEASAGKKAVRNENTHWSSHGP